MPSATLTFDDGTTETITGASMQELSRRAAEFGVTLEAPQEAAGTTAQAASLGFGGRAVGALGSLAERLANIPGEIANPVLRAAFSPTGVSVHDSLPGSMTPAPQIPAVQLPDGGTMAAAIESPMQAVMAGQSLGDAFRRRQDVRNQIAMDRPGATVAGETMADALSLVALRSPARAGQAGGAFDRLAVNGAEGLARLANPAGNPRGVRAAMSALAKSDAVKSLFRGTGRAVESGMEGAITGILQGGDPEEMAYVGAGMQAAGSVANTAMDSLIGPAGARSLTTAGKSVLGGAVLFALLGELAPFDQDTSTEILDDLNTNFEKVASGALLGVTVGLLGARGSNNGAIAKYLPGLADGLTTIPRSAIFSLYTASQTDPSIAVAMQNAPQLGQSDARRFAEILEGDNAPDDLREWMDSNARVRRILSAPDPRLAAVPVREDG